MQQKLNNILQQGVCMGLHLAVIRVGYAPRSRRELGMALGIPNLIHGSRSALPRGNANYMVNALRMLKPHRSYPEKFRDILYSFYKGESRIESPQLVAEDHPLGGFYFV
ncbi:MAG: hypothetical protein ACOX6I_10970 [Syntrophomonadaceae bacterium]